jgi:hypothetical protein
MKLLLTITMLCLFMAHYNASAQERYGKTLNLGIGVGGHVGYSSYAGRSLPVFNVNYEIDVLRNFTLAPFISFYTFSDDYSWSNGSYRYSETVIPVGLKGSYYFDELLDAGSDWDFYAAASAGVAIVRSRWSDGYLGDRNHYNQGRFVFMDIHAAAEYHLNSKLGVFLDLSTGVSTIGLSVRPSR